MLRRLLGRLRGLSTCPVCGSGQTEGWGDGHNLGPGCSYQAAASAGELPSVLRPGVSGGRELLEASE
jgi:hypothetical protein